MAGHTVVLSLFFALFPNVSREDVALPLRQPYTIARKAPSQPKYGEELPCKYSGVGLVVSGMLTTLARRVPQGTRLSRAVALARNMSRSSRSKKKKKYNRNKTHEQIPLKMK